MMVKNKTISIKRNNLIIIGITFLIIIIADIFSGVYVLRAEDMVSDNFAWILITINSVWIVTISVVVLFMVGRYRKKCR